MRYPRPVSSDTRRLSSCRGSSSGIGACGGEAGVLREEARLAPAAIQLAVSKPTRLHVSCAIPVVLLRPALRLALPPTRVSIGPNPMLTYPDLSERQSRRSSPCGESLFTLSSLRSGPDRVSLKSQKAGTQSRRPCSRSCAPPIATCAIVAPCRTWNLPGRRSTRFRLITKVCGRRSNPYESRALLAQIDAQHRRAAGERDRERQIVPNCATA